MLVTAMCEPHGVLGCKECQTPVITTTREADLIEAAWGLIANADTRAINDRDDEWGAAARRWRDEYHRWLSDYCAARCASDPAQVRMDDLRAQRIDNLT